MARKTLLLFILFLSFLFLLCLFHSEEKKKIEKTSVFCYLCGQENIAKAKFCKACGAPIIPIDPSRYLKNFKKKKEYLSNEEIQWNLHRASEAVVRVSIKSPIHYRLPFLGRGSSSHYYSSESVYVQELKWTSVKLAGSGFFISPEGYIVTNAHVVDPFRIQGEIEVEMFDGRKFDAELIGADHATDIAVIKVPGHDFKFLNWIDPNQIKVGEEIWTIGNPLDVGLSITKGIMSSAAKLRAGKWQIENFLSIDAKITHGNSGGPAVDCFGNVVGVNDIGFSDKEALNYCISSTLAQKVAYDLIEDKKIDRSFLGLALSALDERTAKKFHISFKKGVVVEYLVPQSPAKKVGFLPGDLIFEVNGKLTLTTFAVQDRIIHLPPGSTVTIKFMRGQSPKMAKVITAKRPEIPRISPIEDLERHLEGEFQVDRKGHIILTNINEFGLAARVGLRNDTMIQKFYPVDFWEVRDKNWRRMKDPGRPIKIDSMARLEEAISKSYLNERIAFIIEGKDPQRGYVYFPIIIYERPMIIA